MFYIKAKFDCFTSKLAYLHDQLLEYGSQEY